MGSVPSVPAFNPVTSTTSFGNSTTTRIKILDGLGRQILDQANNGTMIGSLTGYDTIETDFDGSGRVVRTTVPFSTTYGGRSSTAAATTVAYDYVGRPHVVTDADRATLTTTYFQGDVKRTHGPSGAAMQSEYDGLGRLVSACNISGQAGSTSCGGQSNGQRLHGSGFWATYAYREDGALLTVNQGSQQRTFTYDNARRMLSESTPESGYRTYSWDYNCGASPNIIGRLGISYNANSGWSTCYTYDALGRMTSSIPLANGLSGNGDTAVFVYDQATVTMGGQQLTSNTPGQLVYTYTCDNMTCSHGSKTQELFSYDSRNNKVGYWQISPNGTLQSSIISYSPIGIVATSSDLGGLTASFDSVGRVSSISAMNNNNPITSMTYGPLGVGSVTYGSGDSDTYSYTNGGKISNVQTKIGLNLYNNTPTWNTNGTLGSLITATGAHVAYGYDDMLRLNSASDGANLAQTYSYDQYGNLSTNGPPFSFLPIYLSNNQIQQVGTCPPTNSSSICYDADGNLLADGDHIYTWDTADQIISIDTHAITRDAFGRMVENAATGNQIFYGLTAHTVLQGSNVIYSQMNLPGGGRILAQPSATFIIHPDFQGNAAIKSTWNQQISGNIAEYSPFGQIYNNGAWDIFNDSNQDMDTFLFDAAYRELHGKQGRWISPDPAGLAAVDPSNPQTWNRYAYVLNNPLSYKDPTGLDCIYFSGGDNVTVSSGDCRSETDDGYYVDGTIVGGANGINNSNYGTAGPDGMLTFYIEGQTDPNSICVSDCTDAIGGVTGDPNASVPTSGSVVIGASFDESVSLLGQAGITPSPLDNALRLINPLHKKDSKHYRDSNPFCSVHLLLDPNSGQNGLPTTGTYHLDLFNPRSFPGDHL